MLRFAVPALAAGFVLSVTTASADELQIPIHAIDDGGIDVVAGGR